MPVVRVPVSFKTTAFHSQYQRILTILVDLLELSSLYPSADAVLLPLPAFVLTLLTLPVPFSL